MRIIAPGVIYPIDWRKKDEVDEPCNAWYQKKQDEKGVRLWKESTAGLHMASSTAPTVAAPVCKD